MYSYPNSAKRPIGEQSGFIRIFQLALVVVFFAGLVYFVKYSDTSIFTGAPKLGGSVAMVPEVRSCLVEVRGDNGSGTGFFVEIKGRNFIVTNLHVLSGNKEVKFYAANGETVNIGTMFGAEDYDIALIQVSSPIATLSVQEKIDQQKLEDKKVIVPGNALGDGVFSAIKGKVLAVGPQLIEVDAKFVSGHSGSPIITKDIMGNHTVLGVATFTKTTKLRGRDKLSRYEDTRWYGYRLDNIKKWQKISWKLFSREAERLHEIETRTEDIIRYFLTGTGPVASDPDIIALHRDMEKPATIGYRSIDSYESTFKAYLTRILLKDIERSHSYKYDYHHKRFEVQKQIREEMANIINQETFFYR